jgi:hypothetical protein
MRRLLALVVLGLAIGAGVGLALRLGAPAAPIPDPPSVVTKIREVARLETLDVRLYKKVSFQPEPVEAGSAWGDVQGWLRHTFRTPTGKALVFADAHLGLDLARLDASSVRIDGRVISLVLPPIRTTIELRPADTEVLGSNLDSAETARLFELARAAFAREVDADVALQAKARASAERQIRALLVTLGFVDVTFVAALPSLAAS